MKYEISNIKTNDANTIALKKALFLAQNTLTSFMARNHSNVAKIKDEKETNIPWYRTARFARRHK